MSPCKIRQAIVADLDDIVAFQRAAIAGIPAREYTRQMLELWHANPAHGLVDLVGARRYLVAVDRDRPVAGAGWDALPDRAGTAAVRAVFVHPDYWAAGLGRMLVARVEEVVSSAGFTTIFVPAALSAARFYEKLGYAAGELAAIDIDGRSLPYRKMWKSAA